MELMPRDDFAPGLVTSRVPGGLELRVAGFTLRLWTSRPVEPAPDGAYVGFALTTGEEFWAIIGLANDQASWNSKQLTRHCRQRCAIGAS
jgi:hypothetical protein